MKGRYYKTTVAKEYQPAFQTGQSLHTKQKRMRVTVLLKNFSSIFFTKIICFPVA